MKFGNYLVIIFIILLSNSHIIAITSTIKERSFKSSNNALRKRTQDGPSIDIEHFLINMIKSSGIPLLDQLGNFLDALKKYDETPQVKEFEGYKCNFQGLKAFYVYKRDDPVFIDSLPSNPGETADPIKSCNEIKGMHDINSLIYKPIHDFVTDKSSNKDKYYELISGKYKPIYNYLLKQKDKDHVENWLHAYSSGVDATFFKTETVDMWMKEQLSFMPSEEQFKIFTNFFDFFVVVNL